MHRRLHMSSAYATLLVIGYHPMSDSAGSAPGEKSRQGVGMRTGNGSVVKTESSGKVIMPEELMQQQAKESEEVPSPSPVPPIESAEKQQRHIDRHFTRDAYKWSTLERAQNLEQIQAAETAKSPTPVDQPLLQRMPEAGTLTGEMKNLRGGESASREEEIHGPSNKKQN